MNTRDTLTALEDRFPDGTFAAVLTMVDEIDDDTAEVAILVNPHPTVEDACEHARRVLADTIDEVASQALPEFDHPAYGDVLEVMAGAGFAMVDAMHDLTARMAEPESLVPCEHGVVWGADVGAGCTLTVVPMSAELRTIMAESGDHR